jgi:DNA-binding response OmpR family regulator
MDSNSKPKILIADDDTQIQTLLSRILIAGGFLCSTASGGDEALESVKNEKPDLLLLDITMPGYNGFEVCENLRKNPDHSHMAIVMLTGRDKESDIVKALEAGADDYVGKPFSQADLLTKINNLLAKAKAGNLPSQNYFKKTGRKGEV